MLTRLSLPDVTLCAVTSVNLAPTLRALRACLDHITFGACVLLTDRQVAPCDERIRVVAVPPLASTAAYSRFVLMDLVDHVATSHCLVVQWDGHVLNADRWRPEYLDYDYIGASWPQFGDGHDVGNGGFSLRSQRLMLACRDLRFDADYAEDVAIGRVNRPFLESLGLRFAPRALADLFSAERRGDPLTSFGYHGVFNMPRALGVAAFWEVYRSLEEYGTVRHDFWLLMREVGRGRGGAGRMARMLLDRLGGVANGR